MPIFENLHRFRFLRLLPLVFLAEALDEQTKHVHYWMDLGTAMNILESSGKYP